MSNLFKDKCLEENGLRKSLKQEKKFYIRTRIRVYIYKDYTIGQNQ